MNDHAQSDPLRVKAFALCAHLEKLCSSAVILVRSGNLQDFDALEARKTIVLLELVRVLKLPELSQFPDVVRSIVDRAGSAIRAELEAVRTAAGQIGMKLSLLRTRAQELSRLRASYGSAFSGPGGARRGPRSLLVDKELSSGNGSEHTEPSAAEIRAREQAAYRFLLNQKSAPYLSDLTLGLLHRYNNVFTGVLFLTDDCLARAAGDEPMQERLQEIANVLRIAHTFVDRVVRLHHEDDEDDISYYDVDAVIAGELETLALLLPKGASVNHGLASPATCFYGSKRVVCEILLHLMENAGEAVPREGGRVWINSRILEGDGLSPRQQVLIHDNGPGFAPDILPRVFEPLFTTKADHGHAGLGLFRARSLARGVYGDLTARNHPDGGAEVILTLAQTNPDSEP